MAVRFSTIHRRGFLPSVEIPRLKCNFLALREGFVVIVCHIWHIHQISVSAVRFSTIHRRGFLPSVEIFHDAHLLLPFDDKCVQMVKWR